MSRSVLEQLGPALHVSGIRAINRTKLAGQAMPLLTDWTEREPSFVAPASPTLSHRS
jgi:hypothetical protein